MSTGLTVTNLAVGPFPNGQPGVALLMTMSDGSTIPVYLTADLAKALIQQISEVITPRPMQLTDLLALNPQ